MKRVNAMNNDMTELDRMKEDFPIYAVSDEALEIAGGNELAGNYTLAVCPG